MHLGLQHLLNTIPFIVDIIESDKKFILYKTNGDDAMLFVYSIRPDNIRNGSSFYGKIHHFHFKNGVPYRGDIRNIWHLESARNDWKKLMEIGYKRLDDEDVQKYTTPLHETEEEVLQEMNEEVDETFVRGFH